MNKYTHIINKYDKNKKEFTTIQVANNLSEWLDFCNKEIPACMSFEFNPKNDKTHGLLYNQAVFLSNSQNGLNHPVVENSKMIDLIDAAYQAGQSAGESLNQPLEALQNSWEDLEAQALAQVDKTSSYLEELVNQTLSDVAEKIGVEWTAT